VTSRSVRATASPARGFRPELPYPTNTPPANPGKASSANSSLADPAASADPAYAATRPADPVTTSAFASPSRSFVVTRTPLRSASATRAETGSPGKGVTASRWVVFGLNERTDPPGVSAAAVNVRAGAGFVAPGRSLGGTGTVSDPVGGTGVTTGGGLDGRTWEAAS